MRVRCGCGCMTHAAAACVGAPGISIINNPELEEHAEKQRQEIESRKQAILEGKGSTASASGRNLRVRGTASH